MRDKAIGHITVREIGPGFMEINNKKSFLYDIIETFLGFCITYPLPILIMYPLTRERALIYRMYLLLPGLLYLAVIRNFAVRNRTYLKFNILPLGVLIVLAGIGLLMIPVYIFLIAASIYSGYKRYKEVVESRYMQSMLLGYGLLLLEYMLSSVLGYTALKNAIVVNCILFSMVFLIYFHLTRVKKLMEWEKQTSKEAICRINFASAKFIVWLSISFGTMTLAIWRRNLFGLGDKVLIWILAQWLNVKMEGFENIEKKAKLDMNMVLDKLNVNIPRNSNVFLQLIMVIVGTLLMISISIIALLVTYAILKMIYEVIKGYILGEESKNSDEKESLLNIKDIFDEIVEKSKRAGKNISSPFDLSNNRKIRRIYYRIVMKTKKHNTEIKNSYTPHKIDEVISMDSNKDITSATLIYEKARYGNCDCKKEDVESIKNLRL